MDNSDDFWDLPAAPEDTYETTVLPTADEPAPEVEKKRNARTVILGSVLLALVVIVGLAAAIGLKNWQTTASTPQATIAPTIPTQDATIAPQAAPTQQAAATTPTAPSTQPAPAVIDPDTLTFASVKQARAVVISKDITAVDGQLVFTLRIALPEGKQGGLTIARMVLSIASDPPTVTRISLSAS